MYVRCTRPCGGLLKLVYLYTHLLERTSTVQKNCLRATTTCRLLLSGCGEMILNSAQCGRHASHADVDQSPAPTPNIEVFLKGSENSSWVQLCPDFTHGTTHASLSASESIKAQTKGQEAYGDCTCHMLLFCITVKNYDDVSLIRMCRSNSPKCSQP